MTRLNPFSCDLCGAGFEVPDGDSPAKLTRSKAGELASDWDLCGDCDGALSKFIEDRRAAADGGTKLRDAVEGS